MSKAMQNQKSQDKPVKTEDADQTKHDENQTSAHPDAAPAPEHDAQEADTQGHETQSQVADAIAAAVASALEKDAAPVVVQEQPTPKKPQPSIQKTGEPEQPVAENQKPATPSRVLPQDGEMEGQKPGTGHKKIARSRVHVPMKGYAATLISGVQERRNEALPPAGVSLRTQEKQLATKTGIDRMLSPVRYGMLLLMFFCLAGRKYSWMTLGFLKDMSGIYIAVAFTAILLVVNWQSVYRAVRDALYLQFSYESYLLVATLLTAIEAIRNQNEDSLMPLLAMSWCFCGIANLMSAQGDLRFLRGAITGKKRVGLRTAKNRYEEQEVIGKAPSGTAGFVRRQGQMDVWHSGNSVFMTVLLLGCIIVSAYLSARMETSYLSVLVYLMDIGTPLSMALCCARPYHLLSQALSGKGALAGWAGIQGLSGNKSVLIYDSDLFPKGTTGHKGVKVFGRYTASQLVSYGASMVLRADVGLDDVFTRLLRDGDGELLEVRGLQILEGGMEGRIHGGRVLLGTYQFMQLMGVDVPRKGSTNGIYIAVNGHLAGMFAIKYALRSGSVGAFRRFTQEKNLTPLIVTRNFTINPAFIEKSYKAPILRMICPKTEIRRTLSQPEWMKGGTTCGFILRDGLSAYSRTVTGARRVRRMGLIYTGLSMVLTVYLTINAILSLSGGGAPVEITRILLMHFILLVAVEIGARVAVRS